MKKVSRLMLLAAFAMLLINSACNMPVPTQTSSVETGVATLQTETALPTGTNAGTPTAFIPITGMDVVSLQCQFCVNDEAHAVLIMSSEVSFNVSDPATGITCATAEEMNGRRILICRGAQQVSFNLNVCTDPANCLQFPVTLNDCPLIPNTGSGTGAPFVTFTPITPVFLTAINTLRPPTSVPSEPQSPTSTGIAPPLPTATSVTTPVPVVTSTTQPPATATPAEVTPQPTVEQPTSQPQATQPPATQPPATDPTEDPSTKPQKPSKTPKN